MPITVELLRNGYEGHKTEEFNSIDWSLNHTPRVIVPVANGSEEVDVVTTADVLRRAKVYVTVASVERSLRIMASQGTKIITDKLIGEAAGSSYDLIVLPGGHAGSELLQKYNILKKLGGYMELLTLHLLSYINMVYSRYY